MKNSNHQFQPPASMGWVSLIVLVAWAGASGLQASSRSSTHYSMIAETMDGGGGTASSTHYASVTSMEPVTIGTAVQSVYVVQHGFLTTPSVPLTLWEQWIDFNFPGETDPLIIGQDADWDGDFLPNVVEFAHGLDPLVGNGGGISLDGLSMQEVGTPVVYVEAISTGVDFRALWTQRLDAVEAGLTYTPQFSHNLVDWYDSPETVSVLNNNGTVNLVSIPYMVFVPNEFLDRARFFRVLINLSTP